MEGMVMKSTQLAIGLSALIFASGCSTVGPPASSYAPAHAKDNQNKLSLCWTTRDFHTVENKQGDPFL
jgi:hypothetical protein